MVHIWRMLEVRIKGDFQQLEVYGKEISIFESAQEVSEKQVFGARCGYERSNRQISGVS